MTKWATKPDVAAVLAQPLSMPTLKSPSPKMAEGTKPRYYAEKMMLNHIDHASKGDSDDDQNYD